MKPRRSIFEPSIYDIRKASVEFHVKVWVSDLSDLNKSTQN